MSQRTFKNPYAATMQKAWQYAEGHRRKFVLTYAMFIVSNILAASYPIFWGWFINKLQLEGTDALQYAWLYGGIYLLIHLVDWAFHGTGRVYERELAFVVGQNYLEDLYRKAVHLSVTWHKDHHSGKTINRIRKAHEALKAFLDAGFRYMHTFGKFTFAFVAILYFSPLFGGIAVLIGLLIIYIIFQFDKQYIRAAHETNEREHVVSSTLFDSLSNIVTVITLRLEKRMEKGLSARISNVFPPFRRKVVVNEWKWFTTDMLVTLIYAITVVGYVYQNWTPGEVFLIGSLVTLVGYVTQFSSVFHDFAYLYTQVVQYDTDIRSVENLEEAYAQQHIAVNGQQLPSNWQQLNIQNVTFSHDTNHFANLENNVPKARGLQDLSIRIKRGQKIALIGESGSGKSTLLALLRGLYHAEIQASVAVDGQVHQGLNIINNQVTLFPQEPEIFENTIEYNITLGLPFEEQEINNALQTAQFEQVLEELPNGLASNIQEKGVNLSGGQKQRLALARGVFVAKFSDIILLDEPTSSVDPKTELLIYKAMFAQFKEKAIISSLHRLHLLPQFDYIYVLDQGRVVAEGSFEELHAGDAVFQALWRHQEEVLEMA
jgi:ABC-type multidrug transport system fused ATPase/permease subunit